MIYSLFIAVRICELRFRAFSAQTFWRRNMGENQVSLSFRYYNYTFCQLKLGE